MGILTAIAIPKFSNIVHTAYITKGKNTLTMVRNAIATERQKRILRNNNIDDIKSLNGSGGVFTTFDDSKGSKVLAYDVKNCITIGCWYTSDGVTYTFKSKERECTFKLEKNRFDDTTPSPGCVELRE